MDFSNSFLTNYLTDKWNVYYHLPDNKKWDDNSYVYLMTLSTMDEVIAFSDYMSENMINSIMFFVMRQKIKPYWEDENNKLGGAFSFKVEKKNVLSVWNLLMYSLCGEDLALNKPAHRLFINGITISPKFDHCIIKIWMKNCSFNNVNILNIDKIDLLCKEGVKFIKHNK